MASAEHNFCRRGTFKLQRILFAIILSACASHGPTITSTPVKIDFSLTDHFVKTACAAKTNAEFQDAWLKHEDEFPIYKALYDTKETVDRRAMVSDFQQSVVCEAVQNFVKAVPAEISRASADVEKLLGVGPKGSVLLTVALQWTDGKTDVLDGRPLIALNSRHPTFSRGTGMRATVLHELFHDAQQARFDSEMTQLSQLERSLYTEGAATYAVETQLDIGQRALGMPPEKLKRAEVLLPTFAAEVRQILKKDTPHIWFRGGERCGRYPCKMGYVLGNQIFHGLSEKLGREQAIQISPREFQMILPYELSVFSKTKRALAESPFDWWLGKWECKTQWTASIKNVLKSGASVDKYEFKYNDGKWTGVYRSQSGAETVSHYFIDSNGESCTMLFQANGGWGVANSQVGSHLSFVGQSTEGTKRSLIKKDIKKISNDEYVLMLHVNAEGYAYLERGLCTRLNDSKVKRPG